MPMKCLNRNWNTTKILLMGFFFCVYPGAKMSGLGHAHSSYTFESRCDHLDRSYCRVTLFLNTVSTNCGHVYETADTLIVKSEPKPATFHFFILVITAVWRLSLLHSTHLRRGLFCVTEIRFFFFFFNYRR